MLALREDQGDFRYKPGKDDSTLSRLGGLLGIECFDADVAGGAQEQAAQEMVEKNGCVSGALHFQCVSS